VLAAVNGDLRWLSGTLIERFGLRPNGLRDAIDALRAPVAEPGELELDDLRRRRLIYRLGPSGAALIGLLLIPGVGPFAAIGASVTATVLGEVTLRKTLEQQRKAVQGQLSGVVDQAIGVFGETVSERLRDLYDQLLDEAVGARQRWHADQLAALSTRVLPDESLPPWGAIAESARSLAAEIATAVSPAGAEPSPPPPGPVASVTNSGTVQEATHA
jgi:hypothetical protein